MQSENPVAAAPVPKPLLRALAGEPVWPPPGAEDGVSRSMALSLARKQES